MKSEGRKIKKKNRTRKYNISEFIIVILRIY